MSPCDCSAPGSCTRTYTHIPHPSLLSWPFKKLHRCTFFGVNVFQRRRKEETSVQRQERLNSATTAGAALRRVSARPAGVRETRRRGQPVPRAMKRAELWAGRPWSTRMFLGSLVTLPIAAAGPGCRRLFFASFLAESSFWKWTEGTINGTSISLYWNSHLFIYSVLYICCLKCWQDLKPPLKWDKCSQTWR